MLILKQEGIYADLCSSNSSSGTTNITIEDAVVGGVMNGDYLTTTVTPAVLDGGRDCGNVSTSGGGEVDKVSERSRGACPFI